MIYVEIRNADGQTSHIEALDAASHLVRWGQNGPSAIFSPHDQPTNMLPLDFMIPDARHSPVSAGPADNPFVLDRGLIFIHNSSNIVDALNATNGSQVAEYTVTVVDSIYGFTVASQ